MRLLIEVGYQKLLFKPSASYAAIIEGFEGVQLVEEEGPYDARGFKPVTGNQEIGIKLISDSDVRLPEARGEILDKLLAVSKERDKLYLENAQLKSKLTAVEKAAA